MNYSLFGGRLFVWTRDDFTGPGFYIGLFGWALHFCKDFPVLLSEKYRQRRVYHLGRFSFTRFRPLV